MELGFLFALSLALLALLAEHRARISSDKETCRILSLLQAALEEHEKTLQLIHKLLRKKGGLIDKALTQGRVSEKLAQRAHSMASSSAVSVAILQRALSAKPLVNREKIQKNNLTLSQLSKARGDSEAADEFFELLEPTLSEEERSLLSDIRKNTNGVHK